MKIIAILITTLIISQYVNAQQTCKIYINDEWQDTRYTVETPSADNVVTDNNTGLMWKQCSEGLSGPDCNTGTSIETAYTWQHALDLASTEDFAGFTDWRVPNLKELRTLVARNCYNTSINETFFPNTPDNLLWSSSPTANGDAFYVSFDIGIEGSFRREGKLPVRLVRSARQ